MGVRLTKAKPLTGKERRRLKGWQLKAAENRHKQAVREWHGHRCRFVQCDCRRYNLFLEVSHLTHKGMGGDPTGERSQPDVMLLVCNWRHKESKYSIDKKRLRWQPLTAMGSRGPIAWEIFADGGWLELARESAPFKWLALAPGQELLLAMLDEEMRTKFA